MSGKTCRAPKMRSYREARSGDYPQFRSAMMENCARVRHCKFLMATIPQPSGSFRFNRAQTLGLMASCTVCGAAAQVLIKTGANTLHSPGLWAMITNPPLVAGYSLYGISTVLLVLALRQSELSLMYPIISLTYVWVTILSILL